MPPGWRAASASCRASTPRKGSRHNGDLTALRRGYRGPATSVHRSRCATTVPRAVADRAPLAVAALACCTIVLGACGSSGNTGTGSQSSGVPAGIKFADLHARARGAELPRPGFEPRDPDHAVAGVPVGPEVVSALAGRRSGLGTPIGAGACSAAADLGVHASARHLGVPRPADGIAAVQPDRLQPDPRYARVLARYPELDRPEFACVQTGGDRV